MGPSDPYGIVPVGGAELAVTIDLTTVSSPGGRSAVQLKIENDGVRDSGGDAVCDGHGTGLAGLRERLGRLGGTVRAQTVAGGHFLTQQ